MEVAVVVSDWLEVSFWLTKSALSVVGAELAASSSVEPDVQPERSRAATKVALPIHL
ncbi:hypothetical protein D3C78_640730 [compost metagenome]